MEVKIEIGTEEQKKLIEGEIRIAEAIADKFLHGIDIKGFVISANCDEEVNRIQNTNDYNGFLARRVEARAVVTDVGGYVVTSPLIFNQRYDTQCRLLLYLHELVHLYNSYKIPRLLITGDSYEIYFLTLYILFDEYCAHRLSMKIMEDVVLSPDLLGEKSQLYKKHIAFKLSSNLRRVMDSDDRVIQLNDIARKYRIDKDIMTYQEKTRDVYDEMAKELIYAVSIADSRETFKRTTALIEQSWIYNDNTSALINFYRQKYEDNDIDLLQGMGLIKRFLMNFGISYEDTDRGIYIRVQGPLQLGRA